MSFKPTLSKRLANMKFMKRSKHESNKKKKNELSANSRQTKLDAIQWIQAQASESLLIIDDRRDEYVSYKTGRQSFGNFNKAIHKMNHPSSKMDAKQEQKQTANKHNNNNNDDSDLTNRQFLLKQRRYRKQKKKKSKNHKNLAHGQQLQQKNNNDGRPNTKRTLKQFERHNKTIGNAMASVPHQQQQQQQPHKRRKYNHQKKQFDNNQHFASNSLDIKKQKQMFLKPEPL